MSTTVQTNDAYLVRVTPGKITKSGQSYEDGLVQLRNEIQTSFFLSTAELKSRIFGKSLGVLSLAIDPVLQALVYYVLTAVVFRGSVGTSFLNLYTVVVLWQLFAKPLGNSPTAFGANAGILKQTNFSLKIVFLSFLSLEFSLWLINFAIMILFLALNGVYPHLSWLQLPYLFLVQISLTIALSFPFAVLGAYIKDLPSLISPIVGIWFYMSPGIYDKSRIPEKYQWLYDLNPFSSLLEGYKKIFFGAGEIRYLDLTVIFAISIGLILLEAKFFKIALRRIYSYL